jgi:hypothetical protein
MNTKNLIGGIVGVVVIVLGVAFVGKPTVNVTVPPSNPTPVQVNVPQQEAPRVYVQPSDVKVNNIPAQPVQVTAPVLGSMTGPDFYGPYMSNNGVKSYTLRQKFNLATTTPCSIKAPTEASTTLVRWGYNIFTGTSTAGIATIGTSTSQYATTSPMFTWPIVASQPSTGQYVASTTGISLYSKDIFMGTEYVVLGISGAAGSATTNGFTYGGYCYATFMAP